MYGRAENGKSPLLDGHGNINEIRSRHSGQNDAIEISCTFSNQHTSTLHLDNSTITKPDRCPIYCYISADRLGPQTVLPLHRSLDMFPYIGDKGEFVLDFLQKLNNALVPEALQHPNSQGKTLNYVLAGWLSEIAPGVEFSFTSDQKADQARAEINSFRPANVGFGLSYTLPVLVAILGMAANAPLTGWEENWGQEWESRRKSKGVLILIENPEAHLHPQGQTAMGRLLALAASCGIQIIVETHSDHLMDGIRISVKEKAIKAEDVAFHFLSKNKDGLSEIKSPLLHGSGKLDFWPDGFFDQTLKNRAILAKKG